MTTLTDEEIQRAQDHAEQARRAGEPATVCPYNANGEGKDRALAARWVAAFLATD